LFCRIGIGGFLIGFRGQRSGAVAVSKVNSEKAGPQVKRKYLSLEGSKHDLNHLLKEVAKTSVKPRLYQCCGTEDFLYSGNLKTRDVAQGLDLDYTYEEGPGMHNWDFWDEWIQRVLTWMAFKD
jgi:S-formylglutathione hydrolase FrmB